MKQRNVAATNCNLSDLLHAFIVVLLFSGCWPDSEFKGNRYFKSLSKSFEELWRKLFRLSVLSCFNFTLWLMKVMKEEDKKKFGEMLKVQKSVTHTHNS